MGASGVAAAATVDRHCDAMSEYADLSRGSTPATWS